MHLQLHLSNVAAVDIAFLLVLVVAAGMWLIAKPTVADLSPEEKNRKTNRRGRRGRTANLARLNLVLYRHYASMNRYLFVFREGSTNIFVSTAAPTEEDIARVKVGLLEIIRLADLQVLTRKGVWEPIDVGVVRSITIEDQVTPPFHVPSAWAKDLES